MHTSDVTPQARLVNLFGALTIAAYDLIDDATQTLNAGAATDVPALNLIAHAPGLSINDLAKALGLSHSATVRLVDRLATSGDVIRESGADQRTVALRPTVQGKRRRRKLQHARLANLRTLIEPLEAGERETLEAIVEKMLVAYVRDVERAAEVCRLCDEHSCASCPMNGLPAM